MSLDLDGAHGGVEIGVCWDGRWGSDLEISGAELEGAISMSKLGKGNGKNRDPTDWELLG